MFPRELLTDGAFWSFSAFYAVSVVVVTAVFLWLLRWRKSPPRIGEHLPRWIAILFTFLLIEQFFHQSEHVTQMYQFGFLGFDARDAHGFLWFLDDEWNHFVFNTVYMAGMTTVFAFFLRGLRTSSIPFSVADLSFIAIFLVMEGWHIVEHTWRITQHVQGLCDQCPGILDPLTGIDRLVLHFWLNVFALIFPAVVYVWFGMPALLLRLFPRRNMAIELSFPSPAR